MLTVGKAEKAIRGGRKKVTAQNFSPKNLREFFGQELIRQRLKILFSKFDRTAQFPSSLFIYGPVGSGKSTLVRIMTQKLGRKIIYLDNINEPSELISQILPAHDQSIFVFNRLEEVPPKIQDLLVRLLKNHRLEIFAGSKKPLQIDLKNSIFIGISSRAGNIPKFIRENFKEIFHLERYKLRELKKIISAAAKGEKVKLENEAAWEIAHSARRNPQKALNLLEKIINFAQNKNQKNINFALAQTALSAAGIDRIGLETFDRDLLKIIIEKFSGGPVGIENYAARLSESPWNIEEIHEPYLIEIGFLKRTPRGRLVTRAAHEYLGYQYAAGKTAGKIGTTKIPRNQKKLF